jgi:hypothetical protein
VQAPRSHNRRKLNIAGHKRPAIIVSARAPLLVVRVLALTRVNPHD